RHSWVFSLDAECCSRHSDLREARADRRLAGDEGCASRRATLLSIEVREVGAFFCNAIDVRRAISHDAVVVAADVEPTDIVRHDEKNVRLLRRHEDLQRVDCARLFPLQATRGYEFQRLDLGPIARLTLLLPTRIRAAHVFRVACWKSEGQTN